MIIVQLIIVATFWMAARLLSRDILQKIQEAVMMNSDYVKIVAVLLAATIGCFVIWKTVSWVEVWKSSEKFFREIWDNKILSLFYLIVIGANVFKVSKSIFGIENLPARVVIASTLPTVCFCTLVCLTVWMLDIFGHTRLVIISKEAVREFFEILENDSFEEGVATVKMTLQQRAWYIAMDYWATFACIGIVAALNYLNLSAIGVTIGTIIFDFVVAFAFMIYSLRSGKDVTFGEGYRRALDVIRRESKVIGFLGMVALNAKATIWDGPEQIPIFFKKELKNFGNMVAILVPLAIVQGIFWAWLYSYGYESVFEAIKAI